MDLKAFCFKALYGLFICASVFLDIAHAQSASTPGNIYLEAGEYKGILIAIDQQVPYNENMYENLKRYFVETSQVLHTATSLVSGRRFAEITILVPKTWPTLSACTTATTEIQYEANFIVERDTQTYGGVPHTLKLDSKCGTPGDATFLPASFVSDTQRDPATAAKTLLHEWAHLRYGLFDELDRVTHPSSCVYLAPNDIRAIKCSTDLTGIFTVNDEARTCSWAPAATQTYTVMGSVMYDPHIEGVLTFCNKTGAGFRHNADIPNPQNDRCGGRSGWEVLMEHPDFKDHTEAAPLISEGMAVRCIQERELDRMVLVMDISGSMQEEHRILRMQQDVQLFLKSMPCRDTSIGMVEFSSNMSEAIITHRLARLDEQDNLQTLLDAIPSSTKDQTCIGCGITRAIELMEQSGRTVDGSVMVIFTDGEETTPPFIEQVRDEVLERGIIVYSILMRDYARNHPLLSLAADSGGRSCIFSDTQHTSYYDCLNAILHHRSPQTAPNQLLNKVVDVRFRSNKEEIVNVDAGIHDRLTIVITWTSAFLSGCKDTLFSARAPDGTLLSNYTATKYSRNEQLRTVSIDASGHSPGRWLIGVDNRDHWEHCQARILVEARRLLLNCSQGLNPDSQQPVLIFPRVGSTVIRVNPDNDLHDNAVKLYTEVLRGQDPVLNATVKAEIENDEGDHWTIDLEDNGVGADLEADDGVYSRYFTNYTGDGTYTVKIDVEGGNTTRVRVGNSTNNGSARYDTLDPFQRTQGSEFFEVIGFDEVEKDDQPALFPPSPVTDLRVTLMTQTPVAGNRKKRDAADVQYLVLMLQWTAVELHDNSAGAHYEIRVDDDTAVLRTSFELAHRVVQQDLREGELDAVRPFGSTETFVVALRKASVRPGLYYVAVKTVDGGGRKSHVSNLGIFTHSAQESSVSTTTRGPANDTGMSSPSAGGVSDKAQASKSSAVPVWVFYILAGLVALLIIMLVVICCMCYRNKKGHDDKTRSKLAAAQRELTVQATYPPGATSIDEVICDIIENQPDRVSLSQEPDLIQQTHSNSSSVDATPNTTISKNTSATWPVVNPNKPKKKQRAHIWKTFGKGTFFSELKKKIRGGGGGAKSHADDRQALGTQWHMASAPVQNIPYSNPLFGQAHTSNEVEVKNSVIDAPFVLDLNP